MSSQPAPFESQIFNVSNFNNLPNVGSTNQANFPTLQGTLTCPNGIIWGDNTYQNSANTGGGGGNVDNPMTSNLDGGGFSITNVDTFAGLFGNFGEVNTTTINDSAAVQYVNMGPVVAGNEYLVAIIASGRDAEGSVTIVSRCLDPGFKQTIVFTLTGFERRGHANVLVNLCESDTPIFEALVVGDDGAGAVFCSLRSQAPSTTWEVRAYMNQDDKGTIGVYGDSWRLPASASIAPPVVTSFVEIRLGFQPEGQATMSGDLDVRDGIACSTLMADASVTTNRVFTNEFRDNGLGIIDTFSPLRMNNNDIQSAGIIGAAAFVASVLGAIVPVGHPTTGPLYVDSGNNRIGINVPAPSEDFEIDGNIQLDSNGANKIKFYDGTATTERAEIDAAASGTGGQLIFYTKEDPGTVTAKMTIQADGRVTITNRLEGVTPPVAGTDAANKDYVDASIPSLAGYVQNPMTVALDAGGFAINNILDPVAPQDAASKNYVDTIVPPAGVQNPMIADLDGGGFNVFNATSLFAVNNVKSGDYIESYENIYAGQALGSPLQAFCKVELPNQSSAFSTVMPQWKNGYLKPQAMFSKCACSESVTAPGANKLNSASLLATSSAAYNLTAPSGLPGTNILIEIPLALDRHTFSIQVDGEWNGSTIGGNGNSYMYIREDANPAGQIYGMSTGQAVDGARYPCCLNFVGALPAGVYCILLGHYDLGANRDYTGDFWVRYLGDFGG